MDKITLVGCSSQKKDYNCKAVYMYSPSKLFQLRLRYARLIDSDYIYILSAKYGLLKLDDEIEPYDLNLNNTSKNYQYRWGASIIKELNKKHNLEKDYFYFLAGNTYIKNISEYIIHTCNPVKGMSIGRQLHFYKTILEE